MRTRPQTERATEVSQQLRAAHELFADMGATAFAERARMDLAPPAGTPSDQLNERPDEYRSFNQ
ncbi:hypothetical protein ABT158_50110 [Nonomuraea sp. NPDC001636]|uniref:hypothetical protein n=1 Tax=Nonomuraea sp. NPDC001636 TaxID=3154391 RepID=UPI0033165427